MSEPLLYGKTALITGAASGIGAAAVQVFSEYGANVVLADLNEDDGHRLAETTVKDGGQAVFVRADIGSATDVQAMVEYAVNRFGRLDCAFNNAGIDGQVGPLHESSKENWDEVLRVNLTGVWLCLKQEITQMLQQEGGAIVNTTSVGGLLGIREMHVSAYIAAKHGVVGLTQQAALEYADHGIRVNAVCPGPVRTRIVDNALRLGHFTESDVTAPVPLKRLAAPEEIARAAAWLCSDAATYVTGHAMPVDGGWTAY